MRFPELVFWFRATLLFWFSVSCGNLESDLGLTNNKLLQVAAVNAVVPSGLVPASCEKNLKDSVSCGKVIEEVCIVRKKM